MSDHRNEDDVLHGIAEVVATVAPRAGEVFIGDDAAVLREFAGQMVISTDVCVANVHLDLNLFTLEDLGFKAVASALSDLAAMGALPRAIVLGVAVPAGTDLTALHRGAAMAATLCDTPIVGGDLTTATDVVVTVTVVGECPTGNSVLRGGARDGDTIVITGPLGRAAAGWRRAQAGVDVNDTSVMAQRRPMPRLREGRVYRAADVTAMMDLSDGLALDLHRLADASGVGFVLFDLPVAEHAMLEEALSGGEDYELLATTGDYNGLREACERAGVAAPIPIGTIVSNPQIRTFRDGELVRRGWQHEL